MKKLNKKTSQIFCQLIDHLHNGYRKYTSDGFMPLSVERINEGINTPYGTANEYSLCHYYDQNGELMQDPEMCFWVVDKRTVHHNGMEWVAVYPISFTQANLGKYERSAWVTEEGIALKLVMQADHAEFAQMWLNNIKNQGFLQL